MGVRRLVRRLAIGVFALVVIADVGLLAGIWVTREPAPLPLDVQRIFIASRPAIVLVQSEFAVTASIPRPEVPKAKQDQLRQQLINMVLSGRLADDQHAIEAEAVNLIVANPGAYIQAGSDRLTDNFTLEGSGSGFFVSQDGYLITAAHVVSPQKSDILAEVNIIKKEPEVIAQGERDLKNSVERDVGVSLSDDQVKQMSSFLQQYEEKYTSIDSVDAKYVLGFGTVLAGESLISTGVRASMVSQEPVPPGRDVAILKAEVSAVPALPLAPTDPGSGAATHVVGYPRHAYLSEPPPSDATVRATLASGAVRAQKSMDGWTAIRTDANITHGNSGGPVLDKNGRVLGIVSFGETDRDGYLIAGQGYFVPVSILKEELQKASIKPAPGNLTNLYYQALSQGDIHRYRKELPLLSEVQSGSSNQAYVKDDIVATQSAILAGQDQTPPKLTDYLPEAGAATGVALVFLAGALIWSRRRPSTVRGPIPESAGEPRADVPAAAPPDDIGPPAPVPVGASPLAEMAPPNGADPDRDRSGASP